MKSKTIEKVASRQPNQEIKSEGTKNRNLHIRNLKMVITIDPMNIK